MEYILDDLLTFAKQNIPQFEERYEMFLAKPEDLIDKKVISIRSGFSNGGGGMVMLVSELNAFNIANNLKLIPCEESSLSSLNRAGHNGWSCDYSERCSSFVFYKPKTNT